MVGSRRKNHTQTAALSTALPAIVQDQPKRSRSNPQIGMPDTEGDHADDVGGEHDIRREMQLRDEDGR